MRLGIASNVAGVVVPPLRQITREGNQLMIRVTLSIWRAVLLAAVASATCAGPASAAFSTANYMPCGSTDGYGSFRATLSYSYTSGTSAAVSIVLTNNTAPALGGYITAIALNPNATAGGMAFVSSTNAAFVNISSPVAASPYGNFLVGAGLGGSFLGGGSPNAGIGVGQSATFSFTMTGTAAALAALDAETALRQTNYGMVVRFRGGQGGWSDKVLGCPLPAPGALALLGAVGLVSRRRPRA